LSCKETNNFIFVSHEKQISDGVGGGGGIPVGKMAKPLFYFHLSLLSTIIHVYQSHQTKWWHGNPDSYNELISEHPVLGECLVTLIIEVGISGYPHQWCSVGA